MSVRRIAWFFVAFAAVAMFAWQWAGTERDGILTITPRWPFSAPVRTLRAFNEATDVEIISLQSWLETTDQGGTDIDAVRRCRGDCLVGNPVLGRIAVTDPARLAELARHLDGWLAKRSDADQHVACAPSYHHAVAWTAHGQRYEALLCFGCAIYRVRVDGKDVIAYDQAGRDAGEDWFNARFAEAGIRYFDVERHEYVPDMKDAPDTAPPSAP